MALLCEAPSNIISSLNAVISMKEISMYYYVPNWLYSQHPSNAYSRRYIFLRPVVAPYTAISGTLFWSTFIMLHRQNTLYSAQGLSQKCIIYVRVLRKSKRQQLYL